MNVLPKMTRLRWAIAIGLVLVIELLNRLAGVSMSLLLTEMLIMALFASSLNLLMSYGHMVSFGHAAYLGLGAYGFTLAVARFDVPVAAAVFIGPIVAAIGGLVFGALCVRLTKIYFAMLTLACAQITFTVLFQWYDFTGGDTGITGFMNPRFGLSERDFTSLVLLVLIVCLMIMAGIVRSPLGLSIRSVGQDRWRAEALGLAPRRVQLTAFVIAAFFHFSLAPLVNWQRKRWKFPGWLAVATTDAQRSSAGRCEPGRSCHCASSSGVTGSSPSR